MSDYRATLRDATTPLHRQIDALFGAFDLGECNGLIRFLMAQAIGMSACQSRVMRFGQDRLGRRPPDHMQALTVDLALLGYDAARLPRLALPGAIADAGVFYVIAGSRMGAALLRKRATALTPAGIAHCACRYFAPGEGAALWQSFRQWLKDEETAAQAGGGLSDLSAIIAAAEATFLLFAEAARWAGRQPIESVARMTIVP